MIVNPPVADQPDGLIFVADGLPLLIRVPEGEVSTTEAEPVTPYLVPAVRTAVGQALPR